MQHHKMSLIRQIPNISIHFKTRQVFVHKGPISWAFSVTKGLNAFPKELNNAMLICKCHQECTREIWVKKIVLPPKQNVNKFDISPVF